ncbi:Rab3 gtpase-activating protein catalytic subunit [Thalictrum thalictroides]|uniref:Rab3 GTPase-activating protein catalytic subunit n=1 Tax=Thalictrum thalictroides TaxID=46969 RepID=A0A7J6WPY2_THATH|nr:Rab3 gtpase-activating protein catalytic subunit [Thalictrum thalictroides]
MGTVLTRRFEADLIGSQVPIRLMHLEGLYDLFVSKFAFCSVDLSTGSFMVDFTMKLTYRTPPNDDEDDIHRGDIEMKESGEDSDIGSHIRPQWDDDCPWAEWYSSEDPIKGFELITIWLNKMVESSSMMAELENASTQEADNWFLIPILSPSLDDDHKGNAVGFASQLRLLVNALDVSFMGQFIEDFVSVEKLGPDSLNSSTTVPPPTVLDRALKDLFHEGLQIPDYSKGEHKSSRTIKGAPLESLFSQFCMHSLWFGDCNIRAVAILWIEFVREVRWCWEESQLLPRMRTDVGIDLSTCLIHQKLQMLAVCIEKKRRSDRVKNMVESSYNSSARSEEGDPTGKQQTQVQVSTEQCDVKSDSPLRPDGRYNSGTIVKKPGTGPDEDLASADLSPSDKLRRGSAGVIGSMMLLKSYQRMHAPYTQDAPIMTEDMHEERLRAVEALGNAFSFSGQLEKDILSSDMSAFKAANPDAVFEDFIRWHSPGDWETAEFEDQRSGCHEMKGQKVDWPPQGRLSTRMSEHGNSWRRIWNDVPALPASEQKPLLDPNREGEKENHFRMWKFM